jgi:arylsulfatase A
VPGAESLGRLVHMRRNTSGPKSLPYLAALIGLPLFLIGNPGYAQDRPNVLIFYTDDQGTLDAGCYGSKDLKTPVIDALAADGVRFTRAYAHTVCCPSRALLMTGRHPQRSGIDSWTQGNMKSKHGVNMFRTEITIAEALKQHGYHTGLVGKWHLGSAATHGPTKQGFDSFYGLRGGFIDNYNHFFLHGSGFHDLYRGTTEQFEPKRYFPDLVVREAKQFLASANKSKQPFFLCVAFNIPHYPEQAGTEFQNAYASLSEPRRSYARMISTTDSRIGKVLATLDALKLRDNTIILFASDNGHSAETSQIRTDNHKSGLPKGHNYGANGGGGNAGKWRGNKGTFFEGGIRVPAILSFKGRIPKGITRDQAVSVADFYPTILDLCGIKAPAVQLDGKSLIPVINSSKAPSPHPVMHWQWMGKWAVRQGNWKLISEGKKIILANLADKHPEQINHAAAEPTLVAELTNLHRAWAKDVMPTPRKAPFRGILRKAGVDPRNVEPWPALSSQKRRAWRSGSAVIFSFAGEVPTRFKIPRLATAIKSVDWRGDRRSVGAVQPEIQHWLLTTKSLPQGLKPLVILQTEGPPALHIDSMLLSPDATGIITMHASAARVSGVKLRFEPQPQKNTLGYWVDLGDYAAWRVQVTKAGNYDIEILQGCGKGQGGSSAVVSVGTKTVPFEILETGHFQNFVRRSVGKVAIPAGNHAVEVRIRNIAKNAAMDLREVRLIPAGSR